MNEELRQYVQEEYDLFIHEVKCIHDSKKTLAIKLDTNQGEFLLKTLYKSEDRQLFIIEVENHLRNRGILIPETRYTRESNPYIIWQGHPYVLQKWVSGKHYPLINSKRVKRMGTALGRTHAASLGFHTERSQLHFSADTWIKEYNEKLAAIKTWKEMNKNDSNEKTSQIIQQLDYFRNHGKEMLKRLLRYPYYFVWINLPFENHYLCHGDFHTQNVKVRGSLFHIIDWEDVCYNFPSRDITRILFVMMRRHKKWDVSMFNSLLSAYLKQNPLTDQQKGLLFLDLTFPHIFERFLNHKNYKNMSFRKVDNFLIRERDKTEYMLEQMLLFLK